MDRHTPVPVTVKLHPQVNSRLEDELKRLNAKSATPYTKQRYIEEAVLRRLSGEWKSL